MVSDISLISPSSQARISLGEAHTFGLTQLTFNESLRVGINSTAIRAVEDKGVVMVVPSSTISSSTRNFDRSEIARICSGLANSRAIKPVAMRLQGSLGFVQQVRSLENGHIAVNTCCRGASDKKGVELVASGAVLSLVDLKRGLAIRAEYFMEQGLPCKGQLNVTLRGQSVTYSHLQTQGSGQWSIIGQLSDNGRALTNSVSYNPGVYLCSDALNRLVDLFRNPYSVSCQDLASRLGIPVVF